MMETRQSDTPARLLGAFAPHSHAQWKEAATELLKGRPFEKTLLTPTWEGFALEPLYTREVLERLTHVTDLPGAGSRARGNRADGYLAAGWRISQELTAPTPEALNRIALDALAKGQDELNLRAAVATADELRSVLEGVHPEMISLYLQGGALAPVQYALLLAELLRRKADLGAIRGCVGMDPVGSMIAGGESAGAEASLLDLMADIVRHAAATVPGLQVVEVQGHAWHNGGASSVQEMGAVLATAVDYLKALNARGVAPELVVPRLRLSLSVGGNYFIEIAKFRAVRLLWSRIAEAFGVPEAARAVHIHARTGLWNKTVFDPYVNMLRTTTEAFAAVVGGVDSLHVGPFDEVVREPDEFSRRIARNTHVILAEECDLRRVVDPAGGSWAVEALTDRMAAEAWKLFQEIEAAGGIMADLRSGRLQEAVENMRQQKAQAIQRRKDILVGINSYPNAGEELLARAPAEPESGHNRARQPGKGGASARVAALNRVAGAGGVSRVEALIAAAAAGATASDLMEALKPGARESVRPVRPARAAEDFEKLRLAARDMKAAGKAPLVHQLNMGPSRKYRIRADWTTAFFQVGGLQVHAQDDYGSIESAVAALRASGARVAVITSDDEHYAEVAEPLARAVKQADVGVRVLLAGAPGDNEAALRAAGVDDFVHIRVNNYTFNRALLLDLGAVL